MAADFHIEDRGERGIYLRSISESAHNFVAVHPILGQIVVGGVLIGKPFVDATLADIARAGLVTTRVTQAAMVRRV
jgi:hypothetical protein